MYMHTSSQDMCVGSQALLVISSSLPPSIPGLRSWWCTPFSAPDTRSGRGLLWCLDGQRWRTVVGRPVDDSGFGHASTDVVDDARRHWADVVGHCHRRRWWAHRDVARRSQVRDRRWQRSLCRWRSTRTTLHVVIVDLLRCFTVRRRRQFNGPGCSHLRSVAFVRRQLCLVHVCVVLHRTRIVIVISLAR